MDGWDQLTWRNSVVELYQDRVEIYAISGGIPTQSVALFFADNNFKEDLAEALAANAAQQRPDKAT